MSTSKKSLQVSEVRRKNMQAVRSKGNKPTEERLIKLYRENKITVEDTYLYRANPTSSEGAQYLLMGAFGISVQNAIVSRRQY